MQILDGVFTLKKNKNEKKKQTNTVNGGVFFYQTDILCTVQSSTTKLNQKYIKPPGYCWVISPCYYCSLLYYSCYIFLLQLLLLLPSFPRFLLRDPQKAPKSPALSRPPGAHQPLDDVGHRPACGRRHALPRGGERYGLHLGVYDLRLAGSKGGKSCL